jgi:3',5'-nucleoside bisphosphate phosphatase
MPRGSPFTRLCESVHQPTHTSQVDLHTHTNCSDGSYSPVELIEAAHRQRLAGLAITDHDTVAAFAAADDRAATLGIELIPGVEITCEFGGFEQHLLGYFFDLHHEELVSKLAWLREKRAERFQQSCELAGKLGWPIELEMVHQHLRSGASLGRRHVAHLLVQSHHARSMSEALTVHLRRPEFGSIPKHRLPIEEGIFLIHAAGGISSWAHPPHDRVDDFLPKLAAFGLDAIECHYPWSKGSISKKMLALASQYQLAVTGGSDCHGPLPVQRNLGRKGISLDAVHHLRQRLESRG